VLLASLITFGNFGERYELLAMKAAGISLLKIMRPLAYGSILLLFRVNISASIVAIGSVTGFFDYFR
jgi:lipopolysaccharide export LptBFGC system permease protein LptF